MDDLEWWQKAVFYQIYPRSFADSNGDGIGDLRGIVDRLDYLQDLGVDAIWLSPHYPSPLCDCGYDVADYTRVAPEYGTLADFQCLLDGLHQRDMRLILDLVLNHTSDQHPWFLESRSSRDNPKRDWYIWKEGCGNRPPNNWYSWFGGSAWELDPLTGQYYYHFFFKEQPDLNWRNPEVRQAMFAAMRFWMEMGVDGFRLDAIGTIFEDPRMPDQQSGMTQADLYRLSRTAATRTGRARAARTSKKMFRYQVDQPEIHGLLQELRRVVAEYPGRVLVGETERTEYYGKAHDELDLVFNFPLLRSKQLTPARVRANQRQRLAHLPPDAWPCNTLGNHDASRIVSHFGDGPNDPASARLCLTLMLTLRGTPFLYNGEEIGMTDLVLDDIAQFRDTLGVWAYQMEIASLGSSPAEALAYAVRFTRDKCRTPMQWSNRPNGGFCPEGVVPWLPVNPNAAQGVNVEDQLRDPGSLLIFYRALLRVRIQTPALICGDYQSLEPTPGCLAFLRNSPKDEQTCLVILNLAGHECQVSLPLEGKTARLLFSSHPRATADEESRPAAPGSLRSLYRRTAWVSRR